MAHSTGSTKDEAISNLMKKISPRNYSVGNRHPTDGGTYQVQVRLQNPSEEHRIEISVFQEGNEWIVELENATFSPQI